MSFADAKALRCAGATRGPSMLPRWSGHEPQQVPRKLRARAQDAASLRRCETQRSTAGRWPGLRICFRMPPLLPQLPQQASSGVGWSASAAASLPRQLGPAQAARRAALRRGAAGFCCARERVASFTLTLQRTCVYLCLCLCFEGMRLGMSISPRQLPRARRENTFRL